MVHDPISVLDALMIALSGIVIVFLMLALLWGVIAVISRVMGALEKHTAHPASVSAAAPAAAAPAAAPAPAPQVKLEGVSEVEAACVMAIVSHETGIPLDQLVFKSALFGNGQVGGDVGLAVTLFVVMDCIMSAIGSTANDSAFSAWVTDVTDVTNRGVVDIVLSIMPILALIVIFAGFDGMTVHGNWTGFFLVLGGLTSAAGVLGLCIFRDSPALRPVQGDTYLRDVLYAFRPANIRANKMIYICFLGMMFSGLAMQLWQPYMISLVEVTLGIDNYILPIGIVVLASAVLSVLAGKAMDRFGKEKFYYPVAILQVLGGLIAYSIKFVGHAMPLLCVGGTCIMAGNLAMAGLFTASSRDYTPAGRAGASQSVKMVIYIMLPMVLASIIDPLIIKAVALEPTAAILAKYPSYAGSYLYPYELFLAAAVSAVFILIPAYFVRRDADRIRREKLAALEK